MKSPHRQRGQGAAAVVAAAWLAITIAAEAAPAPADPQQGPESAAAEPAAPLRKARPSHGVAASSSTQTGAESPLDRRVGLLSAELELSPLQQRQVKALLLSQREAVQQVWGDLSLPPAIRVNRTQAISDRTADGIRALLDEEQRKKYIQPRQREASVGNGGANVEAWAARAPGP